jgi:hypothetical protein
MAVFCGSQKGKNPLFEEHTRQLGHILAKKNITLIYGGGNKGLMAAVANAAIEKKGKVVGVMPTLLRNREQQHEGLSELHIVENMHARKAMLFDKADSAIILPGGFGTLDELFEMLTWNQLDIHLKKIFFLNTAGFYTHLIAHIEHMHQQDFLYNSPEKNITVLDDPKEILLHL